jgi:hypothetical protein
MSETKYSLPPDRFFNLLWRLAKVVWRYFRFVLAAWFAFLCVICLVDLFIVRVLITGALAWVIWPMPIRRRREMSAKEIR